MTEDPLPQLMFLFEDHLGKDTEIPKGFLMKSASSIGRHMLYLLPAGILHIFCGCQNRALLFNGNYILYIRIQIRGCQRVTWTI